MVSTTEGTLKAFITGEKPDFQNILKYCILSNNASGQQYVYGWQIAH